MDKLDQMIAEALAQEDQDILAQTTPQSFFGEFFSQFSGRNAWVNWLTTFMILVYVGLTFWCGYEFFTATEPLAAIPDSLADYQLQLGADGNELTYHYDTQKEHTGITALLGALNGAGIRFNDLRTSQSSLEEIFVGLVKRAR